MKVVHRYLLLNNMLLMGICLLTCTGIYLLVDVFDRLDRMMEKGATAWAVVVYFGTKIPLILSQILPAVVFLGFAIQICGMRKRREIMALEAGGVSFYRLAFFILLLGLFWTGGQMLFSQALGVTGQQVSESIWDSLGQDSGDEEVQLSDVWLRKQEFIVHLATVWPERKSAEGVRVFAVGEEFDNIGIMVQAEALQPGQGGWQLDAAEVFDPQTFEYSQQDSYALPIEFDLGSMYISAEESDPEEMSLSELSAHIKNMQDTGTNVEVLRTAWHLKISYAFSALVLSVAALVLTRHWENLFFVISAGLGVIFLLFAMHTLGGTLGESGALPPWLGAWLGNILIGTLATIVLALQIRGRRS
ncbi:MAG: LptF/LptG family permease [Desulfovermiculus sp.]